MAQLECVIKVICKKTSNIRLPNAKNFLLFSEGKGHSVDSLVPLKGLTQKETEKACLNMIQSTKFQDKQDIPYRLQ